MLIRHTICFINILKIHRKKKKYKYLNYEFFIEQNSPFKKNIHPRNFKNLLYFYTFIIQFKELEFKKGKNKFLNVGKCKIITSTRFEDAGKVIEGISLKKNRRPYTISLKRRSLVELEIEV